MICLGEASYVVGMIPSGAALSSNSARPAGRSKSLVQILRDSSGFSVVDRQAQAGARLLHRLIGAGDAILGNVEGGLILIELLLADRAAANE